MVHGIGSEREEREREKERERESRMLIRKREGTFFFSSFFALLSKV
jgi:hypothetical protein